MMDERGLRVDHTTIYRWVQCYAPELDRRCRPHLKTTTDSWRVDETYIKIKGTWMYLYRAVDSHGNTLEFLLSATRDTPAAKRFFSKALAALAYRHSSRDHGRQKPLLSQSTDRAEGRGHPSSGIQPGVYYLCGTASEGTFPSPQTITVTPTGLAQPTPVGPGSTATSSPGASSTATPGVSSTPGNQGASGSSSDQGNTLVALILICLLILALLVYLIRLWLQGRHAGGQPPRGGGQSATISQRSASCGTGSSRVVRARSCQRDC